MASTLSSLLKPLLLSLTLENVLDAVAQSPHPEMLSLDLTSVKLLSPDLSSALQVCLSGSSSCAHPFYCCCHVPHPPLLLFSYLSCSFFYLCGFSGPYIPKSLSLLDTFY